MVGAKRESDLDIVKRKLKNTPEGKSLFVVIDKAGTLINARHLPSETSNHDAKLQLRIHGRNSQQKGDVHIIASIGAFEKIQEAIMTNWATQMRGFKKFYLIKLKINVLLWQHKKSQVNPGTFLFKII